MAHTSRIYTTENLHIGLEIALPEKAHHHLVNVMRAKVGDKVILFNSAQGAFAATLTQADKKRSIVLLGVQMQSAEVPPQIILCPCLIKPARFDWVLEKATELGVQAVQPILSDYTDITKFNLDRAAGIVQSAVEQSGRTYVPQVFPPQKLATWLAGIKTGTVLWAHESEQTQTILQALQDKPLAPLYLLVGPEGGFSAKEQTLLSAHSAVKAVSLGAYILRAETASLSLLSIVAQIITMHEWPPNSKPNHTR